MVVSLFASLVLASTQAVSPVLAESTSSIYETEPENLATLIGNLKGSLVGVTCQDTGIGVPVSVNFSEEDKNRGRNSYILTSYQLMKECFSYGGPKPKVTYKGKVYDAEAWTYALDGTLDLAAVVTSVNLSAPYWSTYLPEKNWFVLSAQWFKGSALQNYQDAGPVFGQSRISDVNQTGYKFSVKPLPRPLSEMKSGIAFDRNGEILGNLTWMPPWEDGVARISGVPLWCNKKNGSSTEASVLNCSVPREDRWKVTAPRIGVSASPSPTPSPSVSARDNSIEGIDAYNAAIDSYNLFKEARQSCQSAFRGTSAAQRKVLSLVSGTKVCGSQDAAVDIYYKRLLSLRSSASSPSVTTSTIDQINTIANEIEKLTENLDAGTVMGEDLLPLGDGLLQTQLFLDQFSTSFERVNRIIASIPTSLRGTVKRSQDYVDFVELSKVVSDYESTLESYLRDLSFIDSPDDPYYDIIDGVDTLVSEISELGEPSVLTKQVVDAIPSFYCKKSSVLEFPKSGKCKFGYSKVLIKKS